MARLSDGIQIRQGHKVFNPSPGTYLPSSKEGEVWFRGMVWAWKLDQAGFSGYQFKRRNGGLLRKGARFSQYVGCRFSAASASIVLGGIQLAMGLVGFINTEEMHCFISRQGRCHVASVE